MADEPITPGGDNVIPIKSRRGGRRAGAGRKPNPERAAFRRIKNTQHHVYVIHETDHATCCKIGIATDPFSRLSALQVGTWRKLTLAGFVAVADPVIAQAVERHVHVILTGRHESGEWFRVGPDEGMALVRAACESLGVDRQEPVRRQG